MIIETGFSLSGPWGILALMAMAVAMLVNRAGASMVFFDVVGRFQADRLIRDADTSMTVFNAVMLDSFANIQDSLNVIGTAFEGLVNEVLPMTEAIADSTIELEKFLVEANELEEISAEIMNMGIEFGYTGDQALSAAAKMAQLSSVLGAGQTPTGTRLGMEFGLISGMETEAAMQRLINLNQQLYFMTENTNDLMSVEEKSLKIRENTLSVMDRLNTIENRSASTMEQITFVMNQFASQAHLTGESIEMMAAQSAVLIETGEEQGKAGRALKQIYARLGADTNGATRELKNLGIAVEDANGNLRPLSEILGDLNQEWSGLEAAERQAIAQSVAGNRHYTRFIKLMNNYERSVQLATEANEGLFPAMDEVNNRLEADITQYRAAEAALHNYRAELGDALLPALTATTEKQATFTMHLANLVHALDNRYTGGFLQMALGVKALVVPMLGVVTNVAAMTVAMQTNRAVTRAMRGEVLMLEEAFGQGMLVQLQNLNAVRERNQLGSALVEVFRAEFVALEILNEAQKEQLRINIMNEQMTQARIKSEIRQMQTEIRHASLEKAKAEEKQMSMKKGETDYKNQTTVIDEHIRKIAQLQIELEELQMQYDETTGAIRRHSDAYGGSLAAERRKESQDIADENKLRAEQSAGLYAVGGAFLAVGSAMTLFTQNEKAVRLGMAMQIVGTTILTAKQLLLAGSTILKTVAESDSVLATKNLNWETVKATFSFGANTTSKETNTVSTHKNTVAQQANATAMGASGAAAAGGAARTGAAAGSAAGPVGMLLGALAAVVVTFGALSVSAKRSKDSIDEFANVAGNPVETATVNVEVFSDRVLDMSLSLDDLALSASNAETALNDLDGATLDVADSQINALAAVAKTEREAYLGRISQSAVLRDTFEEDVQAILDAQQVVAWASSNMGADPFGSVGSGVNMGDDEWYSQHSINAAKDFLDQEAHLAELISTFIDATPEEIIRAIRANALYVNQLEKDSENAINSMGAVMEAATGSLAEFNNAREELFYGMAASNISGDLVKQVVNRGVEHLLVNTEVIMTNNFNGMTTEQAAQEILDHVERGARMRGIDMSTTSQSV